MQEISDPKLATIPRIMDIWSWIMFAFLDRTCWEDLSLSPGKAKSRSKAILRSATQPWCKYEDIYLVTGQKHTPRPLPSPHATQCFENSSKMQPNKKSQLSSINCNSKKLFRELQSTMQWPPLGTKLKRSVIGIFSWLQIRRISLSWQKPMLASVLQNHFSVK